MQRQGCFEAHVPCGCHRSHGIWRRDAGLKANWQLQAEQIIRISYFKLGDAGYNWAPGSAGFQLEQLPVMRARGVDCEAKYLGWNVEIPRYHANPGRSYI